MVLTFKRWRLCRTTNHYIHKLPTYLMLESIKKKSIIIRHLQIVYFLRARLYHLLQNIAKIWRHCSHSKLLVRMQMFCILNNLSPVFAKIVLKATYLGESTKIRPFDRNTCGVDVSSWHDKYFHFLQHF